jgi:hypothetical protein
MGCATAATENGFSRAGLTLLLPRIGTFASLHVCAIFTFPPTYYLVHGCHRPGEKHVLSYFGNAYSSRSSSIGFMYIRSAIAGMMMEAESEHLSNES